MVTLIFEAEVKITEKQYKEFKKGGHKVVYAGNAVATVFGKEVKFVRWYVKLYGRGQP